MLYVPVHEAEKLLRLLREQAARVKRRDEFIEKQARLNDLAMEEYRKMVREQAEENEALVAMCHDDWEAWRSFYLYPGPEPDWRALARERAQQTKGQDDVVP